MGKNKGNKNKLNQSHSSKKHSAETHSITQNKPTAGTQNSSLSISSNSALSPKTRVQPEQMSLIAHGHIQKYLEDNQKSKLDDKDVTAVLRLAQHLRVFGLLSAVGYLNQSNDQEGKVRERTRPVWKSLLGQLINEDNQANAKVLMAKVVEMAQERPSEYMAAWRRALILANHWNFWARAYQEEKPCKPTADPTPESN